MPVELRSQVRADSACKNVVIGILDKRYSHQEISSLKAFLHWKFIYLCVFEGCAFSIFSALGGCACSR